MRVAFDINVLASALVFPGGCGDEAVHRIIREQDELILSKPLLDQLLSNLAQKFCRDAEEIARVAVFLSTLAILVSPRRRLRVVSDEPDNRMLECALAGHAKAIVTGNSTLLTLHRFRGVQLQSLRGYLRDCTGPTTST